MTPPAALLVAMQTERRALAGLLADGRPDRLEGRPVMVGRLAGQPVVLVQTGLGARRAREAALLVARRYGCGSLWSLGLAGGLDPALSAGALLLPAAVLTPDGVLRAPAVDALRAALGAAAPRGGRLLTAAAAIATIEEKRALRAATGAAAVDMEAAGVADAAAELGLPWVALKAILDPADLPLPAPLARCARADGGLRVGGLLAALLAPRAWRPARAVARNLRPALAALRAGTGEACGAWTRLDRPPPVQ